MPEYTLSDVRKIDTFKNRRQNPLLLYKHLKNWKNAVWLQLQDVFQKL